MTKLLLILFMLVSAINAKSNAKAYMEYLNSQKQTATLSVQQNNEIYVQENEFINDIDTTSDLVEVETTSYEEETTPMKEINEVVQEETDVDLSSKNNTMSIVNSKNKIDIYKDLEMAPKGSKYIRHTKKPVYTYTPKHNVVVDDSVVFSLAGGIAYLSTTNNTNHRRNSNAISAKIGKNFNDIQVSLEYLTNETRDDVLKRKSYLLNIDKTFYNAGDIEIYAGLSAGQSKQKTTTLKQDTIAYGVNLGQRFRFTDNLQAVANIKVLKNDFEHENIKTHDYSTDATLGLNLLF